jgi:hypothetical protein
LPSTLTGAAADDIKASFLDPVDRILGEFAPEAKRRLQIAPPNGEAGFAVLTIRRNAGNSVPF